MKEFGRYTKIYLQKNWPVLLWQFFLDSRGRKDTAQTFPAALSWKIKTGTNLAVNIQHMLWQNSHGSQKKNNFTSSRPLKHTANGLVGNSTAQSVLVALHPALSPFTPCPWISPASTPPSPPRSLFSVKTRRWALLFRLIRGAWVASHAGHFHSRAGNAEVEIINS